jgi:hypothetical protein
MITLALPYDGMDSSRRKKKNPDRIVNINKEKYEINSLHSCYDFICKEIFVVRLSKYQYKSTLTILIICKKKNKKKLNINIASILLCDPCRFTLRVRILSEQFCLVFLFVFF